MQQPGLIMDIRKWLAEIEHPVPSERPVVKPFLFPRQPDSVPDARRRRKRSLTDSSLLKSPSPQPLGKGEPDLRHVRDAAYSNISHSMHSELASNRTTGQCYTRRPRYKTRPDRYEAETQKSKGRDGNLHPSRKSESRKSRRRSRRRKAEKTHSGMRHEFHANNVSKDRLTLKPPGKMGLFSKGVASTTAQGRGLPDLVFSEMMFLRNGHVEKKRSAQAPDAKKKRKKDHAQTKEEDISAFFTCVRPALADMAANQLASSGRPTMNTPAAETYRHERMRELSSVQGSAVRTIYLEDRASYLESDSRGPYRESTSYFSGSESSFAPSTRPGHRKCISAIHGEQFGSSYYEKKDGSHRHALVRRQETSSAVREPIVAVTEQARESSIAPVHSGFFRLPSLLQRSSSPRQSISIDQVLNRGPTKDEPPASSMSPMLRSSGNIDSPEHPVISGSRRVGSIATCYESEGTVLDQKQVSKDASRTLVYCQNPQGSSSLSGILQHCNDASQAERPRTALCRNHNADMRSSRDPRDTVGQSRQRAYQRSMHVPTVQFLAPDTQPRQLARFSDPSFYAQQEQRQHLRIPFGVEEEDHVQHTDNFGQGHADEMRFSIQEDVEGLSEEPVPYAMMEEFDDEDDDEDEDEDDDEDDDDDDDDIAGLNVAADDVEQGRGQGCAKDMACSFWQPNKLY